MERSVDEMTLPPVCVVGEVSDINEQLEELQEEKQKELELRQLIDTGFRDFSFDENDDEFYYVPGNPADHWPELERQGDGDGAEEDLECGTPLGDKSLNFLPHPLASNLREYVEASRQSGVTPQRVRSNSDTDLTGPPRREVVGEDAAPVDADSLKILCQRQRKWLNEIRDEKDRDAAAHEETLTTLRHELILAEADVSYAQHQSEAVTKRLAAEEDRVRALNKQVSSYEARCTELDAECRRQHSELELYAAENSELADRIASLSETTALSDLRRSHAEQLAQVRENMSAQLTQCTAQLEARERQVVELERHLNEADLRLSRARAEVVSVKAESAELRKHCKAGTVPPPPAAAATQSPRQSPVEEEEKFSHFARSHELGELRGQLESAEAEVNRLEEEVADLHSAAEVKESQCQQLRDRLESLVGESDSDKTAALEACRSACLRLHEDVKLRMLEQHEAALEALRQDLNEALAEKQQEVESLHCKIADIQGCYVALSTDQSRQQKRVKQELKQLVAVSAEQLGRCTAVQLHRLEQLESRLNVIVSKSKSAADNGTISKLSAAVQRSANASSQTDECYQHSKEVVEKMRAQFIATVEQIKHDYLAHVSRLQKEHSTALKTERASVRRQYLAYMRRAASGGDVSEVAFQEVETAQ